MSDIINRLWNSTDDLHRRFDKYPPDANETLAVFDEESTEFTSVAWEIWNEGEGSVGECAQEAADVVVTVLATLTALGITREQFADACAAVAAKNDAKTHDTHYIRADGKIARKSRSELP